jgi:hypothetical protein
MAKRTPKLQFIKVFEDLVSINPIGERLGESVRNDGLGNNIYFSEYTWGDNTVLLVVGYDPSGKISGIFFQPQHALPYDTKGYYLDKTDYKLPFNGVWWVYWGGDTEIENYHIKSPDQRHAYDLVVEKNGRSYKGSGNSDADYYDFGLPVISPANCRVVDVVDGVPDNPPNVLNPKAPAGNHVILSCGHGEYIVMAHFKDHSLVIRRGQVLKTGQLIGQCGNSGNTTEPHLHVQLQDVPTLPHATSLPLYFVHFFRDGEKVRLGQIKQGEYVHN